MLLDYDSGSGGKVGWITIRWVDNHSKLDVIFLRYSYNLKISITRWYIDQHTICLFLDYMICLPVLLSGTPTNCVSICSCSGLSTHPPTHQLTYSSIHRIHSSIHSMHPILISHQLSFHPFVHPSTHSGIRPSNNLFTLPINPLFKLLSERLWQQTGYS